MPLQAPGGFIGGYMAGKAFRQDQAAGAADIAYKESETAKNEDALRLSQKALQDSLQVADTISKIPDLAKLMHDDPAAAIADMATVMAPTQPDLAATMLGQAATARESAAKAADARTKVETTQASHIGSAMQGVHDARSWQLGLMGYLALHPDDLPHVQALMELPDGNPNFDYAGQAQKIVGASMTALQQAQTRQADAAAEHNKQLTAQSKAYVRDVIPSIKKANDARADASRKAGDKPTEASRAAQTELKNMILSEFDAPDAATKAQVDVLAHDLATGVDKTTDVAKVFADAKEAHRFAGLAPVEREPGTSPDVPLPIPLIDGKIDLAKVEPNMFYSPSSGKYAGKAYVWNPKTKMFDPVQGKK